MTTAIKDKSSLVALADKDTEVMSVPVNKGVVPDVTVKYADSTGKVMNKKNTEDVEQEVVLNENISAPIDEGQVLGRVNFKIDGEEIASVELVAENDVGKLNVFTMWKRIFKQWFFLLRK